MKNLIINADDFGMSEIYNKEIIKLVEYGKISSVSVMTKRGIENQVDDVLKLKKVMGKRNISIGVHLEFTEKESDYTKNIENQIKNFRKVFGCTPSHLDVHKGSPDEVCVNQIHKIALQVGVPFLNLLNLTFYSKSSTGEMYLATRKSREEADKWLNSLENNKIYEIVFHPGKYDPNIVSSLNAERENDIEMINYLYDNLENYNIKLISFKDL